MKAVKVICRKAMLTISLLCISSLVLAQQGGFIVPSDSSKSFFPVERAIYLPPDGLNFYDSPNGDFAGRITQGPPGNPADGQLPTLDHLNHMEATIKRQGMSPQRLDNSFFFQTYDDCLYIPFDKNEGGFLRIINGTPEVWLSIEEIENAGFQVVSWMDFYSEIGKVIVPPPNATRPLKISPYIDAETLVEVDENYFEIQVQAFDENHSQEGFFCYVKATQFRVHPCYGGGYDGNNVVAVYEGWLQIVDLDGNLLVFHNSHGC